jgi:hypothetical protein
VEFFWEESLDPDLDTISYTIEFDTVSTFNSGAFQSVLAGTPTSALVELPRSTQHYYWRVRASDGRTSTLSLDFRRINITYINHPPMAFDLLFPPDDTVYVFEDEDPVIDFSWEASVDPDSDIVSYILQIDTSATFASPALTDSLTGSSTGSSVGFPHLDQTYYWRVKATDGVDTLVSSGSRVVHIMVITSAGESGEVPKESALEQNYPNPFNPATTIKYTIPTGGSIRLGVFNMLGQLVKVIYEGTQAAGTYEMEFRSDDIPSGIYFYRIEAPGFVETKKMVIAK